MSENFKKNVLDTIARAIDRSDKTMFFESYHRQAKTVLKDLEAQGYVIVPLDIDKKTLDSASRILSDGRHHPKDIVNEIFRDIISSYNK